MRAIRRITGRALERISPQLGTLYANFGWPSIPPEKLLRALFLQRQILRMAAHCSEHHRTCAGCALDLG